MPERHTWRSFLTLRYHKLSQKEYQVKYLQYYFLLTLYFKGLTDSSDFLFVYELTESVTGHCYSYCGREVNLAVLFYHMDFCLQPL